MKTRPKFLEGKDIFLGPLSKDDALDDYASWLNDAATTLYMGSGRFPATADGLRDYIERYNASKDGILLGIFLKKQARHIGNITLHQIDWRNRNAEIGLLIGEKDMRGKGYATEAIRLVAGHAFSKLNIRKIYAGMIKGNDASKRAFEKLGFKVEGVLREHFYLEGRYIDCYRMGLLESELKNSAINGGDS